MLIGFNVLTLASATIYSVAHGLLSSLPLISSLFDDSMQNRNKKLQKKYNTQQTKIKKSRKIVTSQKNSLINNAPKQAAKRVGAALIPFAGFVIVAGIWAQEYCDRLKGNIDLHNALNNTTEEFDYSKCYNEVEKGIVDTWKSFKDWF